MKDKGSAAGSSSIPYPSSLACLRVLRVSVVNFSPSFHFASSPAVWSKKATHLGRFSMSSGTLPCSYSMEK